MFLKIKFTTLLQTKGHTKCKEVARLEKEKKQAKYFVDPKGVDAVKQQINESYQTGVIEDQLENNRGIHHFNNKSR